MRRFANLPISKKLMELELNSFPFQFEMLLGTDLILVKASVSTCIKGNKNSSKIRGRTHTKYFSIQFKMFLDAIFII